MFFLFFKNGILHFDFNSIMNFSLVIHQRNFKCKKKKRQKSQKYITSKENFSNFVFYYSDTEAHLYLNDFCQLSSTLQVQKKKYEI